MFYKAYEAYMNHAFPADELLPLSCTGRSFPLTAGSLLTLVDTLDTLIVLGNYSEFARAVELVSELSNYDVDDVSLF